MRWEADFLKVWMGGLVTVLHNHIAHGFARMTRKENEKKAFIRTAELFSKKNKKEQIQFRISKFRIYSVCKVRIRAFRPTVSINWGLQEDEGEDMSARPDGQEMGGGSWVLKPACLPV